MSKRESLKRRVIETDFRNYLRGGEPLAVELATAPTLDLWSVHIAKPRGMFSMSLRGEVSGHHDHPDGVRIETSAVVWLDRKHRWARTRNRVYRLDGAEITNDGIVD